MSKPYFVEKLPHLGVAALGAITAVGIASVPAQAVDFSFTGSLSDDADTQSFFFTTDGTSNVMLRTYSYAGGTNAAGMNILAGGFDPILSLFDSAGNLIDTVDDGPDPVPSDPVTGSAFDTNFSQVLIAGTYRVVVSQFDNFASGPTFADGFDQSSPTFTSVFECSNGQFCDVNNDNRTNNWAFDITNVVDASMTTTPEPGTVIGLLAVGVLGLGLKRKKEQD